MKTILTFILLALTTGIYAETTANNTQPDFQVLLSGLPDGEARYIVEEGFSIDEDTPGKYTSTWIASYDCIGNGSMWSITLPPPRDFHQNDRFINSKMTMNYYICPSIDINVEQGKMLNLDSCEKISSHHVDLDFIVKNNKIGAVYTPNMLNIDATSVANHFPACTPKPHNPVKAYPHSMQP